MFYDLHYLLASLALLLATRNTGASRMGARDAEWDAVVESSGENESAARRRKSNYWETEMVWPSEKVAMLMDRFHGDTGVMRQVQYTFKPTNHEKDVPKDLRPKVAIMFLVKDDVEQHDLWKKFFSGADAANEPYSIYFHQYAPDLDSSKAAREAWKDFSAIYAPTVKTGWGQLAGVEFALIWEALRDPANAQFVFSSEGTVPFKSASYVYRYLISEGSAERSKVCFRKPEKYFALVETEMMSHCIYRDPLQAVALPVSRASTRHEGEKRSDTLLPEWKGRVRKHDQWVILARRHAVDVLKNGDRAMKKFLYAVLKAYQPKVGDPCATGCSDESFVGTALLAESELQVPEAPLTDSLSELQRYGVDSECTTFTYWRHCWKHTALSSMVGWNQSKRRDLRQLYEAAKHTAIAEWTHAKNGLVKTLNDSPRDFGQSDAKPTIDYLQALVNTGLLFGRKFGRDETGKVSPYLSEELPKLWEKWDAGPRNFTEEHRAWPTTDTGDKRVAHTAAQRIPAGIAQLHEGLGALNTWMQKEHAQWHLFHEKHHHH